VQSYNFFSISTCLNGNSEHFAASTSINKLTSVIFLLKRKVFLYGIRHAFFPSNRWERWQQAEVIVVLDAEA